MTEHRSEEYWSSHFDITMGDLDRIAGRLQHDHTPQSLEAIALPVIQGRIEHGHDFNSSGIPEEQADSILAQHGERILSCLEKALRQDSRFTSLEGKWYLVQKLYHIEVESLRAVHHFLLENQPALLDTILPVIKTGPAADPFLLKMAVQAALQASPERFENVGTSTRPQWKARLPAHDQAQVIHFAFDPQTFEILCRPGQRLSQKKAQRLQELSLYAHVVTFPEWRPLANR